MRDAKKLIIGAATIWPFVYMIGFMTFIFSSIGSPEAANFSMAAIIPLHIVTMISMFGLLIYFVLHLMKNAALDTTKKVIWAICLVQLNMFVMPVYWYLHIWSTRHTTAPLVDVAKSTDEDFTKAHSYLNSDADTQAQHDMEEFERKLAEVPQTHG